MSLIRAINKNDFNLLQSDDCTEIKAMKQEVPEITKFSAYIINLRK